MPKNLIAADLTVEELSIQSDGSGKVTGLTATVNVAYGEARIREQFDLWAELSTSQRTSFQGMYNKLTQRLQATYIA